MLRTGKTATFILLFCFSIFIFNPAIVKAQMIGEVIPTGEGGTIKSDNLSSLIKRVQPLFVDTTLSTEDQGQLTFVLNDGSIIELAKNTKVKTSGSLKNYTLELQEGEVAYKVAKGSSLTIKTKNAEVAVPYDQPPASSDDTLEKNPTIGLVAYDGQRTTVYAERGDVKVTDVVRKGEPVRVAAGEQYNVEGEETMMAEEESEKEKIAEPIVPEEPVQEVAKVEGTGVGMSTTTKVLLAVGGALLVGGAVYAISSGGDSGGGSTASPSVP